MGPRAPAPLCAGIALLLASAAHAGELDVSVALPPAAPSALTYLDVVAGPLPTLAFSGADGSRYRLGLVLAPLGEGVVQIDAAIDQIKLKRNGVEKVERVATPVLRTGDGQPAELAFALPGKGGRIEITVLPRLSAELNRPPMVESAAD